MSEYMKNKCNSRSHLYCIYFLFAFFFYHGEKTTTNKQKFLQYIVENRNFSVT